MVNMEAPASVAQAVAIAPARFVPAAEAIDVPRARTRQVSAYIEEVWAPVYGTTDSTDMLEILRASERLVGWNVTQRIAASAKARMTAEQYAEVLQSAQFQVADEFYNQYYETIVGNDPIEIDGKIVTGGTRITGGRREYREKTKGYVHWDAGYVKERNAALAELDSRPRRNVRRALEAHAGEVLPMHRKMANPRYDRKAAV